MKANYMISIWGKPDSGGRQTYKSWIEDSVDITLTTEVQIWLAENDVEWTLRQGPFIGFENKGDMVKFILMWE